MAKKKPTITPSLRIKISNHDGESLTTWELEPDEVASAKALGAECGKLVARAIREHIEEGKGDVAALELSFGWGKPYEDES